MLSTHFAHGVAHMALYLDTAIPSGKVSAPATPVVRVSLPGPSAVYVLSCVAISSAIHVVFGRPVLAIAAGLAILVWTYVALREQSAAITDEGSSPTQ